MTTSTFSTPASTSTGLSGRFAGWMAARRARAAQRAIYRQTLRELSGMTDRDLNDIGISRLSIDSIAYEAAYGHAR